jgi:hypothetical protein
VRYFRVELVWINRAKVPHIFLRSPAADLYSKSERQYGPKPHVPLFCRIWELWQVTFSGAPPQARRVIFVIERSRKSVFLRGRQIRRHADALPLMRRYSKRDKKGPVNERSRYLVMIDLEPHNSDGRSLSEKPVDNPGVVPAISEGDLYFANDCGARRIGRRRFWRGCLFIGTGSQRNDYSDQEHETD